MMHADRSKLLKQNVLMALAVKAGSICCTMVLVPMTIDFVNPTQYGIWLTISSVVMWMQFFDVGFSNGLRNRLAEALAHDDTRLGQSLVSTTYAMLTAIFGILLLITAPLVSHCDLTGLLGIDSAYRHDLSQAMLVLVCYFCINMVVRTLSYVLMARQRTALSSLFDFIGQLGVLLTIWVLKARVEGSLLMLALALCLPPLLVWVIASAGFYAGPYRMLRPRLSLASRTDVRSLLNLGVKFFIIQIAFIIQFQTSTFLIGRLFSMTQVTSYNLAYRYFNVLYMAFFLCIEPLWSAVTDAWASSDRDWIRRSIRRYTMLVLLCAIVGAVMLTASPWVYDLWVNRHVDEPVMMPFSLSAWMLLYVMSLMTGQVFCTFVNGIGALRIQFCTSLISPIVFVVATLIMACALDMGMECVLIASILANCNGLILAPLQYWMVIHRNQKGIWTA